VRFKSGFWGETLTDHGTWDLELTKTGLRVDQGAPIPFIAITGLSVRDGLVWDELTISVKDRGPIVIDASRDDRLKIDAALRKSVVGAVQAAAPDAPRACAVAAREFEVIAKTKRYLGHRELTTWAQRHGFTQLREAVSHPMFQEAFGGAERTPAVELIADLAGAAKKRNQAFVRAELEAFKDYFDTVESRPLTEEQRIAAVTMQDRNLVVAAAGSGKTSVIVGKAGYAVQRGYATPEEILVLAFNKDAVKEIEVRVNARLKPLLGGKSIVVRTFHGLGQDVLAKAEGVKPSVLNEAAAGDSAMAQLLKRLVDSLLERDPGFAADWTLFRSVCLRPARDPHEFDTRDEWDRYIAMTGQRAADTTAYLTMRDEAVKSQGELAIANWLFLQGVDYQYEAKYKHLTATETHRQYHPDFYLPAIDAYLEHYALDEQGRPPRAFEPEYSRSMAWKRDMHRECKTRLIETTFHQFVTGTLFEHLAAELGRLGQPLKPRSAAEVNAALCDSQGADYDRLMSGVVPAFLKHAKSNQVKLEDMERKAGQSKNPFRSGLFARLASRILAAYEEHLTAAGVIDFEDMIVRARGHVAYGRVQLPFKLILVDEFQDISNDRAMLVKAMLEAQPDCKLCVVGDDWQAIYRFAGSDVSIFRNFARVFGSSEVLFLSQTFRSNQGIADLATRFVSQPTDPFVKRVRAVDRERDKVVQAWLYSQAPEAVQRLRQALEAFAAEAHAAGERRSVFVLCRYRALMDHIPSFDDLRADLSIEVRTMHRSKGLQADYVAVMGLTEGGAYCFPSETADEPLLHLVMPEPESDRFAEERRLMYVALTRARHKVALIGRQYRGSRFLTELIEDPGMEPMFAVAAGLSSDLGADPAAASRCPSCGRGMLRLINGRYGPFYGCSSYPRCEHKQQAGQSDEFQKAERRRQQLTANQAAVRARHEGRR